LLFISSLHDALPIYSKYSFEIRLARGVCCLERRQRFAASVDRQQHWECRQIDIEALRVEHLGHEAAVGDRWAVAKTEPAARLRRDRKSTRLNSSHGS